MISFIYFCSHSQCWLICSHLQQSIVRGFPDSSGGKESALQCRRPWFNSWVGEILWRRDRLPTPVVLGFPCGSAGQESACNAGYLGSNTGLKKSPGEGKGYPLQYSGLENSMDCIIHGVAKSHTRLSSFHFHFPVQCHEPLSIVLQVLCLINRLALRAA